MLAEQLGIEVLTESFGVVALFQGVAFTVNPPVAGSDGVVVFVVVIDVHVILILDPVS